MALLPLARLKKLCEKNQLQKALPALRERLRVYPNEWATLNLLTHCLTATQQLDAAQAACDRSLELNPAQADVWNTAANLALQRKDTDHALACIAHAKRLSSNNLNSPSNLNTQLQQAQILMQAHRWAEVTPLLTSLYERLPNELPVKQLYLNMLIKQENYALAQPLAQTLCDGYPSLNNLCNHAATLIELGRSQEAQTELRSGLRFFLNNPPKNPAAPPATPYMNPDIAKVALRALHSTMAKLHIPFFLFAGTLLGIVRDGDLLPHDKDMDVGLPWATPRIPLVEALVGHGFVCPQIEAYRNNPPDWYMTVVHQATGITIDFFFAKPNNGKVEMGFAKGQEALLQTFETFKLAPLNYAGLTFMAPTPAEPHLAEAYGDNWQTPDANYDTTLIGSNLSPASQNISHALGLNRLVGHLSHSQWKKAHGYCLQFQTIIDDPLINQLKTYLETNFKEDWFTPKTP